MSLIVTLKGGKAKNLTKNSDFSPRRMDCRVEPGNDEGVFHLRRYAPADEEAAIALWLATWQQTYPQFDFAARLSWWREHWRKLAQTATIVVASAAAAADRARLIGFVTIEPATHYLDQLVVAPEFWGKSDFRGQTLGAALIDEAKLLSPDFIDLDVNTDNARAIAFYRKCGFVVTGDGVNAVSGRPVHHMRWRPGA